MVMVDNLAASGDVQLKKDRLSCHLGHPSFRFLPLDLSEKDTTTALFAELRPEVVVHLAAAVGVRASLENPDSYVQSNVAAFTQILEGCRRQKVRHLIYASSSSVYGLNQRLPYRERDPVDHPISLYAATKRANELMAHAWSQLYALPTTGLRFFTVYGPWGRPDMALHRFTSAILRGEPITLYNSGDMARDFTYVGDVVEALLRLLDHPPTADPARPADRPDQSPAPFRLCNVGNHQPVALVELIRLLENAIGKEAVVELLPMQAGDVQQTAADAGVLAELTGFAPSTPMEVGIGHYLAWFRDYYRM